MMTCRIAVAAALALLMAGCKTAEPAVQIRYVDRPVLRVEKCIAAEDIPEAPAELGRRPSSDARMLADLLYAKVLEWEIFGAKAVPVMQGCAGD